MERHIIVMFNSTILIPFCIKIQKDISDKQRQALYTLQGYFLHGWTPK